MQHDSGELAGPARHLVLRRLDVLWDVDTTVQDSRKASLLTWQIARMMSRDLYLLTSCMNYRCRNPRYRDEIEACFQRLDRVVESLTQRAADLAMPRYAPHAAGVVEIRSHEALRLFAIYCAYDRLLYKINAALPPHQFAEVFSGFTHAYGRFKLAVIPNHGNPDVGDVSALSASDDD
ncbi:hypothetical protein [Noviherbaspirillum pedocola]|uniref:Uncharacterized protein n=1 Tax=Noviherbaspirillum pedocola TaxID=2801341 RepID=A0A934T1N4_9BURK|nr:hypothetical protein [Noviherbaspirillum pedocola]MBK4735953.1 hypothetical protein [Noviherbaspirillum pedocola]